LEVLTDNICQEIIWKSGRLDFTNNFIRQTVEKLANKPNVNPIFHSLKGVIAYMSWVIKHELHDAVKCSSEKFTFKANIEAKKANDNSADKGKNEEQLVENTMKKTKQEKIQTSLKPTKTKPKTIWEKARMNIIDCMGDHGELYDKHWLQPLAAQINDKEKTIVLQTEKEYVADWIKANCIGHVQRAIAELGYKLLEVRV